MCKRHAGFISISRESTFNDCISMTEFSYVAVVVPNPGIVIAIISFLDLPSISNVFTVTSNARVESIPPEMAITVFLTPVCSILLASPEDCILNTSSHRLLAKS